MSSAGPTILLLAGEPSGDLHGARVARALRRRWPDARLFGLGGPRMADEGVELLAGLDRLAVMGFSEVAGHLPFFYRLFHRLRREMAQRATDLVIPIDYPGFNLRFAGAARRAGVPVLYYIAPQVWAWHRSRMRQLAERTDRLAVILPFEAPIFAESGARAEFVGHPLLEAQREAEPAAAFRERLGIERDRPLLALFPGSREQEVRRHLELFGAAAERLRRTHPDLQPVVAAGAALPRTLYADAGLPVTDDSRALLRHAWLALVKSGTTTLEASLAGTPMVVAYRTSPITYWLARRLVRVDHIALVNLVAGERLVPELVQDGATPEALAAALAPLAGDGPARARVAAGLERVRDALAAPEGSVGPAERVAQIAAEILEAR